MTRKIHLVDDDDALREALAERLEGTGYAVAAYDRAQEFLDAIVDVGPSEIVLSDIFMPGMTGLEMLDKMAEVGAVVPVVFMTGFGDVPLAVEAMSRGAVTFLEKPITAAALDKALAAAFEAAENSPATAGLDALSPREKDILAKCAEGRSAKETGLDLGVSYKTVEAHRANIKTKLGVPALKDAVALWRRAEGGA